MTPFKHDAIQIIGAREGNLKNISLSIPRNKLVVLTGLSGSGKSTLAMDVLYKECQRQYLEAMGYQGIQKPKVDSIQNLSPAIKISSGDYNRNPRSSVGTVTDIYTALRMVYEKLSERVCPSCKQTIKSSDCKEVLEKAHSDFTVYMFCCECGYKMEKLTRSRFSFNTREGACEKCHGLGESLEVNLEKVLCEELSLEDGAVAFWDALYKDYQIASLEMAFKVYGLEPTNRKAVKNFTKEQRLLLLYGAESEEVKSLFPEKSVPKKVSDGRFEGVLTTLWRRLSEKGGLSKQLEPYFRSTVCGACHGEKLSELSRSATVLSTGLSALANLSLEELQTFMQRLTKSLSERETALVEPYLLDIETKIRRIANAGLGYLSLDRQTMTLSGGESQRIKLAATLDSSLTGIIYIMDEPTIGLHPVDTAGIIKILKDLRNLGNTVIVIEHDTDVMKAADHIVDIGPGSGKYGGEIIAVGSLEELLKQDLSVTGSYLRREKIPNIGIRKTDKGFVEVVNANRFNLKNVNVKFPVGCLTSVTGVSGSGKSTLVFEVLANGANGTTGLNSQNSKFNVVLGSEVFDKVITVEQSALSRMKRSNVATYCDLYIEIRKIFGALDEAKEKGLDLKHFSFNTKGGRCENCEGLGYVESNMLFFENIDVLCPVCGGNQFNEEVLSVTYKGYSIKEVLKLSVEEAVTLFNHHAKIKKILKLLQDVGLSYLELGQTLTTLSGGEGQRLKLAKELIVSENKRNLYLIDEPTTGLHPLDVENFLILLNRMVDAGNTVIVVEHSIQVIEASDWVIDLGPLGGIHGGEVIATGTPLDIAKSDISQTGRALRKT